MVLLWYHENTFSQELLLIKFSQDLQFMIKFGICCMLFNFSFGLDDKHSVLSVNLQERIIHLIHLSYRTFTR